MPILAESYVHRINPFLIDFGHGFGIRWYGIAYLCGFLIAWLLLRRLARTGRTLLKPSQVGDFITAGIIGVIVGGRVGHVVFYEPHLLWEFSSTIPFWGLLEINRGGMSSHGGMIGVLVATMWFAIRRNISLWHMLDVAAFIAPPGLGFGRIANFINGELVGKPISASMQQDPPWWSLKFPQEVLDPAFVGRQAMMVLRPSSIDPVEFPQHVYRALIERAEPLTSQVLPLLPARYPSQFFQAATDGVILMALLVAVWWRPRKPGVIGAWFLIGYGVLRLVTEQFREPDAGVKHLGGLTLPMALSVGMVVAGLLLGVFASRREAEPVWGTGPRRAA